MRGPATHVTRVSLPSYAVQAMQLFMDHSFVCKWTKDYTLLYILHSTLYTLHSTLYTLHSTLYTLHSTRYTLHATRDTLHSTLYTLHSTLYTLHSTLYTLHSILYTLLYYDQDRRGDPMPLRLEVARVESVQNTPAWVSYTRFGEGRTGSALMGSLQFSVCVDRGTFWVLPLFYFYLPQKCQGEPFFTYTRSAQRIRSEERDKTHETYIRTTSQTCT